MAIEPVEGNAEFQQKARLICNFLRNCKWPDRRFPAPDSPFIIGIYGSDQISEFLRENIQDRLVQGRPVQIRRISQKQELSVCHLVFVSRSERERLKLIISETRRENVLTVGETENFLASGGVIQFTGNGAQVRYQVSLEAARRERIEPNGFVLRMALPQSAARRPEVRRIVGTP
ncbi:MAG: YfiR family protein [Chthoniobacteraceae bacterium]